MFSYIQLDPPFSVGALSVVLSRGTAEKSLAQSPFFPVLHTGGDAQDHYLPLAGQSKHL